jgi:RNA polymerase sigma-70 factor, ECF subfamily
VCDQLQLVQAVRKGDRDAFLDLIEPLEDKLYQTALGIVGNRHDAEDVWQNTVLQAWRNIGTLRQPVFKTWITRILLNEAKQALRRRGNAPILQEWLPEEGAEDTDVPTRLAVHQCLAELAPEQRQAVILRFWLDLSLEEMAESMGVPLSTAKTRLYQGLANVKSRMKEGEAL